MQILRVLAILAGTAMNAPGLPGTVCKRLPGVASLALPKAK
jgi:hypothetical protein